MAKKPTSFESDLQLERQLCFALYSASLAMTKAYKPWLDTLGLTYPQYLVLLVLWEHDGLMVSEIGGRLSIDSGTLTPLLKRLEAAGYLERLRDGADERRVIVRLTPQGARLKAQAEHIPGCMLAAAGCTVDQARDLTDRIKQVRARLQPSR